MKVASLLKYENGNQSALHTWESFSVRKWRDSIIHGMTK